MQRFQPIYDIAELCFRKGIVDAVFCPGSRCAPLTLAFARHGKITKRIFSDERSAGFIGLGIAQQTNKPVVLLCTSGTAVYNFAPAVAEAFFQRIPLIILTADRPTEWIGQHDGQTIFQGEAFGKHVKRFYQLPQEYEHPDNTWTINRTINEAINLALEGAQGPVHINLPFREPLYPASEDVINFSENIRVIKDQGILQDLSEDLIQELNKEWGNYQNILIVAGQGDFDSKLIDTLSKSTHDIPVVSEVITNLHPLHNGIRHADVFLSKASSDVKKTLRPDLLITFGKSVISKSLKVFLRQYPPRSHWHIQASGRVADTFQNVTRIVRTEPIQFLSFMNSLNKKPEFESQKQTNYLKLWEIEERRAVRCLEAFFPQPELGELECVKEVIKALPEKSHLHLANSMSVRYANIIGLNELHTGIKVFANRGTSGIDGCSSTAVGHCLSSTVLNVLITGDLAFFYDRNAFWHNYPLPNLRIVLLNNHGGIIFKMIDGPSNLPETDEYFVTQQKLSAKKLSEEFDFDYLELSHRRKLKNLLKDFFEEDGRAKILELQTNITLNKDIFEDLKQKMKNSYEH